jgi:hypothetical protein
MWPLPIPQYPVAPSRVARGKAKLADDIRVLDGQRFLELLPLTRSVVTEELAIAEPQPNVLNSPSSMTCVLELIFNDLPTSSVVSTEAGALTSVCAVGIICRLPRR